ncbi:hypothetical protein GGI25_004243 [Coemansia spiralis]|uniref:UBC core domain-containing protein n=1 Tax=Coemansia spiralis TaxID=417178 RepID=A0A9W8G579_9FUNG|nr:hypothetical protein GGI25_004243 [Coemansia spiralis]
MDSKNSRLMKEFRMLQSELPPGILCTPKHERLDSYEASIIGPPNTPYANGRFLIDISLSERYPIEPPSLKFKSKIYHPNIDDYGNICLDILKSGKKGSWNPSWTLAKVLVSLTLLLSNPNPHDPLMPEIADQLLNDRPGFDKTANEWTAKYAMSFSDDPAEYTFTSQEPVTNATGKQSQATVSSQSSQEIEPKPQEPTAKSPAKRIAPADLTISAAATTKRKLGLSRKSASPSPDSTNPLPPLPAKLPSTNSIRRLGLSRSRNSSVKHQQQKQSSPSKQATDSSSQAESIEILSEDSYIAPYNPPPQQPALLLSPKTEDNRHKIDAQPAKRQKKGTSNSNNSSSLSQILANSQRNSKQKVQTAESKKKDKGLRSSQASSCAQSSDPEPKRLHLVDSALPKVPALKMEIASQYTSESGVNNESEELIYIHDPICSPNSMDYECLLGTDKSLNSYSSIDTNRKTEEKHSDLDVLPASIDMPTVDENEEMKPLEPAENNNSNSDPWQPVDSSITASKNTSNYNAETLKTGTASASTSSKQKGKAADRYIPLVDTDNSYDSGEQKVLYESHFGPLELGLPPIRVSTQRRLMRRRGKNEGA